MIFSLRPYEYRCFPRLFVLGNKFTCSSWPIPCGRRYSSNSPRLPPLRPWCPGEWLKLASCSPFLGCRRFGCWDPPSGSWTHCRRWPKSKRRHRRSKRSIAICYTVSPHPWWHLDPPFCWFCLDFHGIPQQEQEPNHSYSSKPNKLLPWGCLRGQRAPYHV